MSQDCLRFGNPVEGKLGSRGLDLALTPFSKACSVRAICSHGTKQERMHFQQWCFLFLSTRPQRSTGSKHPCEECQDNSLHGGREQRIPRTLVVLDHGLVPKGLVLGRLVGCRLCGSTCHVQRRPYACLLAELPFFFLGSQEMFFEKAQQQ